MPDPRRTRRSFAQSGYSWADQLRAGQEERRNAQTALAGERTAAKYMEQARRNVDEEERLAAKLQQEQAKERQRQRNAELEARARQTGRPIYKNEFGDWQYRDSDDAWNRQQKFKATNAEREARYRKDGRQFFTDKATGEITPEVSDDVFESRKKAEQRAESSERLTRDAEEKLRYHQDLQRVEEAKVAREAALARKRLAEAEKNLGTSPEDRERLRDEAKTAQDRHDELLTSKPDRELWAIEQERQLRQTKQDVSRIKDDIKAGRSPDWFSSQRQTVTPVQAVDPETLDPASAREHANTETERFNADAETFQKDVDQIVAQDTDFQQRLDALRQENLALSQTGATTLVPSLVKDDQGNDIEEPWDPRLYQQFKKTWLEAVEANTASQPVRESLAQRQQELQTRAAEVNKANEVAERKRREQRTADLQGMRKQPGMAATADELAKLDADYLRIVDQLDPQNSEEDRVALDAITSQYEQSLNTAVSAGVERQKAAHNALGALRASHNAAVNDRGLESYYDYLRRNGITNAGPEDQTNPHFNRWGAQAEAAIKGEVLDAENEAAKVGRQFGLTPVESKNLYRDIQKATENWSEWGSDKSRVLSTGEIVVNPSLFVDAAGYKKAVDGSSASDEAKARAIAKQPELEEASLAALVPALHGAPGFLKFANQNGASILVNSFGNPQDVDGNKLYTPQDIKEGLKNSKFRTAAELVRAYRESPEGNNWWKNQAHQFMIGVAAGGASMIQQATGAYAAITGNKDAAWVSSEMTDALQQMGRASGAMNNGQWTYKLTQGGTSIVPALAGGMGVSAVGRVLLSGRMATMAAAEQAALMSQLGISGSSAAAGFQSFGSTWSEGYHAYRQQGLSDEEAQGKALAPAIASGLTTALVTRGFGATGAESIFAANELRATGKELLKGILKGAGYEASEEAIDQFFQGIIAASSYQPGKPLKDIILEAVEAGAIGGVLGGGMTAVTNADRPLEVNATGDVEGDPGQAQPAPAQPADLVDPPRVTNLQQTADLAASDTELQAFDAGDPTVTAQTVMQAQTLRDIARGATLESLTDEQLATVGVIRDEAGAIKNVKAKDGAIPLVKVENGQPIITQGAITLLERRFPRTRALISMSESEARQRISQQQTESPAPTDANVTGAEATGKPRGSSTQAVAVPADSGTGVAAEGAAEASLVDAAPAIPVPKVASYGNKVFAKVDGRWVTESGEEAPPEVARILDVAPNEYRGDSIEEMSSVAPVTPDQAPNEQTTAPRIAPDEAMPGEVLAEPQAPGGWSVQKQGGKVVFRPGDSATESQPEQPAVAPDRAVLDLARPMIQAARTSGNARVASTLLGRAKLLSEAVRKMSGSFSNVRFVTTPPDVGPASLAFEDGALQLDVERILPTMAAKSVKEAREWVETMLDEEFRHRVALDLETSSPEFAQDLSSLYDSLPDSVKELSRAAYYANADKPGQKVQFPRPENDPTYFARHEFFRQYWQSSKLQKATESALARRGMLSTLRRLIANFLKELRRIQKGTKSPQIKTLADKLIAQAEAKAAELKGDPAVKESLTAQTAPNDTSLTPQIGQVSQQPEIPQDERSNQAVPKVSVDGRKDSGTVEDTEGEEAAAVGELSAPAPPRVTQGPDMKQDMQSQSAWMTNTARALGYDSVDALAESDPQAIQKLSRLWRVMHARDTEGNFVQNHAIDAIFTDFYGSKKHPSLGKSANRARSLAGRAAAAVEGGISETSAERHEVERDSGATGRGEASALVRWAEENGLLIRKFPEKYRPYSENEDGGDTMEHHVFLNSGGRVVKITREGSFGLWPVPRLDEWDMSNKAATAGRYLRSISDRSAELGDDIVLHAVFSDGRGNVQIVTSQPDYAGEKAGEFVDDADPIVQKAMAEAAQREVAQAMSGMGFVPVSDDGRTYYRASDNTAIFDAHLGNIMWMEPSPGARVAVPFDVTVMRPVGKLKENLERAIQNRPSSSNQDLFSPTPGEPYTGPYADIINALSVHLNDTEPTAEELAALEEFMAMDGPASPPPLAPTPEPKVEPRKTSIKNAVVNEERAARGLDPLPEPSRRGWDTVTEAAEAQLRQDPSAGHTLLEELKQRPRPITDQENALLLLHKVITMNRWKEAAAEVNNSEPDSEENKQAKARYDTLANRYNEIDLYGKQAGTELGRGLNARKMLRDTEISEEWLMQRYRTEANLGKPLNDQQKATVKKRAARIKRAQREVDALDDEAQAKAAEKALQRLAADMAKSPKREGVRALVKSKAKNARERIRAAMGLSAPPTGNAQDAAYLAAVERGDMETAQRMVDEAAKKAGYIEQGSHGLAFGDLIGNSFDAQRLGENTKAGSATLGFFFASDKTARSYGLKSLNPEKSSDISTLAQSIVEPLYRLIPSGTSSRLDFERERGEEAFRADSMDEMRPDEFIDSTYSYIEEILNDVEFRADELPNEGDVLASVEAARDRLSRTIGELDFSSASDVSMVNAKLKLQNPLIHDQQGKHYRERTFYDVITEAKLLGHDGVIIKNTYDGGPLDDVKVVFGAEQIKSAAPVTRDDQGDVIPLSQRFNPASNSILYAPAPSKISDADLAIVGAELIADGITSANAFAEAIEKEFGITLGKDASRLFLAAKRQYDADVAEFERANKPAALVAAAKESESGVDLSLLTKLAKSYIRQGVTEAEDLTAKITADLQAVQPGITQSEVNRLLSGYGKTTQPSNDQIQRQLTDIKAQLRLMSGIEDVDAGKAPLKSGFQRGKPSAKVRDLFNRLRDDMRKAGIETTSEEQLASARKAVINRLQNQIADLDRIIKGKGKRRADQSPIEYDAEMNALLKERNELKAYVDDLLGPNAELKWNRRAQQAAKASEEYYKRRIATADFESRKLPGQTENADTRKAREEAKKAKEEFERLREATGIPQAEQLASIKEQLEKEIEKVRQRLITGQKLASAGRQAPTDAEVQQLQQTLKNLRESVKLVEGVKGQTEEQRIAATEKAVQKSIDELNRRIKTGDTVAKARREPADSPKLRQLREDRDFLREIYDGLKEAQNPRKLPEEIALSNFRRHIERKRQELVNGLRAEKYLELPAPDPLFQTRRDRARFELRKAREEWNTELFNAKLAARPTIKKILSGIGEGLNLSRSVLTSLDLSAVIRQGGFIALGHPALAAKSFGPMLRAFRSEENQFKAMEEIKARKNYPLYEQSKLYLTDMDELDLSKMEENYMSRLANKIPLVAGSQRAYVTFLNKLRADTFDLLTATLGRDGRVTEAEGKAIANFINVATGRGIIGSSEKPQGTPVLSTIFFSPRLMASRFNLLGGQPLYGGTPRTRALVAQQYGRFLVGASAALALLALFKDSDDDEPLLELDPRSSDFLKARFGNTRLDIFGGLLQATVLLSRLTTGQTKKKGRIVDIRGPNKPYSGDSTMDVLAKFIRSKLSPALGTAVNLAQGQDFAGEPVTLQGEAAKMLIPMSLTNIKDVMEDQGVPRGTALTLISLFGAGLQSYDSGHTIPLDPPTLEELAKNWNASLPEGSDARWTPGQPQSDDYTLTSQNDKGEKVKTEMSPEQKVAFDKLRQKMRADTLSQIDPQTVKKPDVATIKRVKEVRSQSTKDAREIIARKDWQDRTLKTFGFDRKAPDRPGFGWARKLWEQRERARSVDN